MDHREIKKVIRLIRFCQVLQGGVECGPRRTTDCNSFSRPVGSLRESLSGVDYDQGSCGFLFLLLVRPFGKLLAVMCLFRIVSMYSQYLCAEAKSLDESSFFCSSKDQSVAFLESENLQAQVQYCIIHLVQRTRTYPAADW